MNPEKQALEIMKELYERRSKELEAALKRLAEVDHIITVAGCSCIEDDCPCCCETCTSCEISRVIR